ncbi:hypothetical protein TgHK011_001903 [Trichoderma gracile]|nr:hypothetical protein TgHK011_001903 [Trichoderma gracile]
MAAPERPLGTSLPARTASNPAQVAARHPQPAKFSAALADKPARLARHSRNSHHKERNRPEAEDKERIDKEQTTAGDTTHDAEEEPKTDRQTRPRTRGGHGRRTEPQTQSHNYETDARTHRRAWRKSAGQENLQEKQRGETRHTEAAQVGQKKTVRGRPQRASERPQTKRETAEAEKPFNAPASPLLSPPPLLPSRQPASQPASRCRLLRALPVLWMLPPCPAYAASHLPT